MNEQQHIPSMLLVATGQDKFDEYRGLGVSAINFKFLEATAGSRYQRAIGRTFLWSSRDPR